MNVLYMAKQTPSSIPSLQYLIDKGINIVFAVIRKSDDLLVDICVDHNIPFGNESDFWEYESKNSVSIDWILSYYWKKVGRELLEFPRIGSINFHPGPLPEARGSGYHIAILENWGYWGVTVHYMDEEYDTGRIIKVNRFELKNNIINCELVKTTHRRLTELFIETIDLLESGVIPTGINQETGTFYSIKEIDRYKKVEDNDSNEMINRRIRAFWNPPYMGATITINGEDYTLVNDDILRYIAEYDNGLL